MREMRAILSICEQYNIPLVEDAAEALGVLLRSSGGFNGCLFLLLMATKSSPLLAVACYFRTMVRASSRPATQLKLVKT